eukprot:TRINITY_DN11555_c0_g1_i1.p1 TRINITY_DN11555_c0_g1~~TRINITY_DN11555_c0_g1_i1.p1  ORF type:complete len:175 (-),score=49.41 TRINITY_DN11555_c0_g1_i1:72-596(-)
MGLARVTDIVLALFFTAFVFVSVTLEGPVCLGEKVSPESTNYFVAQSYFWGLEADNIWIQQPTWSRSAVCFHAFGFAPFYATFALGYLLKWRWIRQLAVAVCAAKLYAGALYMTANLMDPDYPPTNPWLFVAQSASYMLIPLLTLIREWAGPKRSSSSDHAKSSSRSSDKTKIH